jgi:hypothetical protein
MADDRRAQVRLSGRVPPDFAGFNIIRWLAASGRQSYKKLAAPLAPKKRCEQNDVRTPERLLSAIQLFIKDNPDYTAF